MYESHRAPLAPRRTFVRRLAYHGLAAALLLAVSLAAGMAGYHCLESLSWLDSFVSASMILTGMGPVGSPVTVAGKLFSGLYAIFSGVIFLGSVGVMVAPILHRLLHKMHLDPGGK